ncbi:putative MRPL19-mitochondrial ribosomal protein, large subunit [Tilletiaria anomala UBC 951]|uniref:Putative MRPL19-mitochondrial ribosomal protein, large subunit n=1 Tax=Tilletiaria anomala (strain ATCC 24038 / CBS 436.72 / UBC 951) TaxID=1037660 RepID=A0A066VZ04_TILAU|nr:putative MRPL19-mitochondrial ribosomal protein, large subunit [Tilletiaria anomala UBC 951]KDN43760.1 putative MRPL19-mitochondrial ribosomal protein, large subunit [Tilletiaria anomala UBC 951]
MSKKGGQSAAAAASTLVKLLVPAGKASAQPPVGPALGAKGVKAMDFAKEFNARTGHFEPGIPIPTIVTIAPDRTFTFSTKTPPTSLLLKRAAGITTGSGKAGHELRGTISLKHIYEIAKIKLGDAPAASSPSGATTAAAGGAQGEAVATLGEEQMCKVVLGSARSMGIRIVR